MALTSLIGRLPALGLLVLLTGACTSSSTGQPVSTRDLPGSMERVWPAAVASAYELGGRVVHEHRPSGSLTVAVALEEIGSTVLLDVTVVEYFERTEVSVRARIPNRSELTEEEQAALAILQRRYLAHLERLTPRRR